MIKSTEKTYTIRISQKTMDIIKEQGHFGQTYDEVIQGLYNKQKITKLTQQLKKKESDTKKEPKNKKYVKKIEFTADDIQRDMEDR